MVLLDHYRMSGFRLGTYCAGQARSRGFVIIKSTLVHCSHCGFIRAWNGKSPSTCSQVQGVLGDPVLEVVLEPGDVLYMPRGTIHQVNGSGDGSWWQDK